MVVACHRPTPTPTGPADDPAPATPSEAVRVGAFLGDRLRVRPPKNGREVIAVAARALWLEPAPGPRPRPPSSRPPVVGPGAPANAPGSDGELVARFLLAHVPAYRGHIRSINHTTSLRILRPLLDPEYTHFRGDTFDDLDFRPTRRAHPGDADDHHDASDYADGRWLQGLRSLALKGGADGHRSLLGRPLPRLPPSPGPVAR